MPRGRHGRRFKEPYFKINPETRCWEWLHVLSHGYAHTFVLGSPRGSYVYAHVLFYKKLVGEVPAGMELDHLCRNRKCINPEHLEPVTKKENIRRSSGTKLNPEAVTEIRRLTSLGTQHKGIARKFAISPSLVSLIVRRKVWADVP